MDAGVWLSVGMYVNPCCVFIVATDGAGFVCAQAIFLSSAGP